MLVNMRVFTPRQGCYSLTHLAHVGDRCHSPYVWAGQKQHSHP